MCTCSPVEDLLYGTGWDGCDPDLLKLGIQSMLTAGWSLIDVFLLMDVFLLVVDTGTLQNVYTASLHIVT